MKTLVRVTGPIGPIIFDPDRFVIARPKDPYVGRRTSGRISEDGFETSITLDQGGSFLVSQTIGEVKAAVEQAYRC